MKQAFVATIFGWLAGLAVLSVTIFKEAGLDASDFYILVWSAVVVFPTCIPIAALLLRLLSPASPLRKPWLAAIIGATAGPVGLLVWLVHFPASVSEFIIFLESGFAMAASLTGAVFAFSLAWMKRIPKPDL
ncbi:MAG TPA: hypothetical protein VG733_20320 [Chthoniobacteraceae bacterium]|nr:hypothetical protein [Chthoniobacteraceae bacterium]